MEGKSAAGEIIRSKIYPPNHPGDARGDEITGSRYRGKFRVNDERYCFSRVSGMNERTVDEGGGEGTEEEDRAQGFWKQEGEGRSWGRNPFVPSSR